MPTPSDVNSQSGVLELAASLDLNAAGPLADAMHKRLGRDLTLDGSKVQRCGAPCLQVLLAAARSWAGEGVSLTLENATPRMIEDLRLLGMDPGTFLDGATPQ